MPEGSSARVFSCAHSQELKQFTSNYIHSGFGPTVRRKFNYLNDEGSFKLKLRVINPTQREQKARDTHFSGHRKSVKYYPRIM
jgi:hypothetical protein